MGVAQPLAMGVARPLAVGVAYRLRGKCLGGSLGASSGKKTWRGKLCKEGASPGLDCGGLMGAWERMAARAPGSCPASPLDFRLEGPEHNTCHLRELCAWGVTSPL